MEYSDLLYSPESSNYADYSNTKVRWENSDYKNGGKKTRKVKMLLLGAGESGKSTFMRQMSILHGNGISDTERLFFRGKIYENLIDSVQRIAFAIIAFQVDVEVGLSPKERDQLMRLISFSLPRPKDSPPLPPTLPSPYRLNPDRINPYSSSPQLPTPPNEGYHSKSYPVPTPITPTLRSRVQTVYRPFLTPEGNAKKARARDFKARNGEDFDYRRMLERAFAVQDMRNLLGLNEWDPSNLTLDFVKGAWDANAFTSPRRPPRPPSPGATTVSSRATTRTADWQIASFDSAASLITNGTDASISTTYVSEAKYGALSSIDRKELKEEFHARAIRVREREKTSDKFWEGFFSATGGSKRKAVKKTKKPVYTREEECWACPSERRIPTEILTIIKCLWDNEKLIEGVLKWQPHFYLMNNWAHFVSNAHRIGAYYYRPSDSDILHMRYKTEGATETSFTTAGVTFLMYDVGGQRAERKKWIHLFEEVHVVAFFVSLIEYDQFLLEDETANRLDETFGLFDAIANSRWFKDTVVILLLNKVDLLKRKLRFVSFKQYVPQYPGEDDATEVIDWLVKRFKAANRQRLSMHCHRISAIDTQLVSLTITCIADYILAKNMSTAGIF
ncbi:G-alpha-domain-containing protein [Atractiella rhizophila]|nr:G-alpha-domain-containing protein [Atractiella rhizophila]